MGARIELRVSYGRCEGREALVSQGLASPTLDDDFATLTTPHRFGDEISEEEIQAGIRVVRAYWPKGGRPRELPEKWR